ncbi:MAG: RNA polymerase sigma factor [Bacteroidota bacterium]|nr:RNA polymerase sigma factor [Bacteroidota bacterium]
MLRFKRKYTDNTDEQLIQLLIAGDSKAFNELYHRYNQRLLYYFYRMLGNSNEKAQDFLQDIFIKLIDKAETFDSSKKFSTWIFSIAHNLCKNEYRRMNIRKTAEIDTFLEVLPDEQETIPEWHRINMDDFISDLFAELENFDEIHKTVFLLRYREEFSVKDISQTLDISEGTVKSRLFYTRKRLSELLSKYQNAFIPD